MASPGREMCRWILPNGASRLSGPAPAPTSTRSAGRTSSTSTAVRRPHGPGLGHVGRERVHPQEQRDPVSPASVGATGNSAERLSLGSAIDFSRFPSSLAGRSAAGPRESTARRPRAIPLANHPAMPECRAPRRNPRRHRGGSSWLRSSFILCARAHDRLQLICISLG